VPIDRTVVRFERDDLDTVVEEMTRFAEGADGRRWVNISPDVDEGEIATGSRVGRLFSGRGPVVPMATWFPEHVRRGATEPTQLGIAHAAGKDAIPRLGERGVVLPGDWVVIQDHQRRGIVVAVPPWAPIETVARYVAGALVVLSPFETGGRFVAVFNRS
jgi:hypothetical protein